MPIRSGRGTGSIGLLATLDDRLGTCPSALPLQFAELRADVHRSGTVLGDLADQVAALPERILDRPADEAVDLRQGLFDDGAQLT